MIVARFLLFIAVLWAVCRWKSMTGEIKLILLVALMLRLGFGLRRHNPVAVGGDASYYMEMAERFEHGRPMDTFHPPLYSVWLALTYPQKDRGRNPDPTNPHVQIADPCYRENERLPLPEGCHGNAD